MKDIAKHEHATLQVLLEAEVSVEMLVVLSSFKLFPQQK